jgi:hypothetical protein
MTEPGATFSEEDFPPPELLQVLGRLLDDPGEQSFEERIAAAREALACAQLRDFQLTYDAPLTVGRFFDNLFNAFDNSGFRIPPEPRDARERFCKSTE